jgi:hypothetical protein
MPRARARRLNLSNDDVDLVENAKWAKARAGGQIIDEAGNVRLLSLHDAVTCFGVSSL